MELPIGAAVVCQDGEAGRLKYVAIDPATNAITDLVVEQGALLKRNVVVPVQWVRTSDAQQIMLNAKIGDLQLLPEYRDVTFTQPDPTYRPVSGHRVEDTRIWVSPYVELGGGRPQLTARVRLGVHEGTVLLRHGVTVHAADGSKVGHVHHLGTQNVLIIPTAWMERCRQTISQAPGGAQPWSRALPSLPL